MAETEQPLRRKGKTPLHGRPLDENGAIEFRETTKLDGDNEDPKAEPPTGTPFKETAPLDEK